MEHYSLGSLFRESVSFTTDDVAADPDTVIFRMKRDSDPISKDVVYTFGVDIQVVQDSVGHYHVDLSLVVAGLYDIRWEGWISGTPEQPVWAGDDKVSIDESPFYD
jgi:hypothetical protein